MINVRCETGTRFLGWKLAVMAVVLLSLVSCSSGKKKQDQERIGALAANRYQLGWRYFQEGEVRRSLGEFQESVRLQPRNVHYQTSLGQAYLFLREFDLAEEHLRKAIKINPAFSEAHHNLAMVFSELGDYDSAEEEYSAALEDPAYLYPEKVYLNWGETLKKKGDMEGAEEKMRAAVELNPRYAFGYEALGRLLESRGEDEAALQAYLKAYAGMAEYAELNLQIGEIYMRQGRTEQAIKYLQKVIEIAPPESSEALRAEAVLQDLVSG